MLELDGGYNHSVTYAPDEHMVIKTFEHEDGGRSVNLRLLAEVWALKHIAVAPELRGVHQNKVYMSFAEGTRSLDAEVLEMPERLQHSVFFKAGETLSGIHNRTRRPADDYHQGHIDAAHANLEAAAEALIAKGIDPQQVYDYLNDSYYMPEVERQGLVWNHGDFWLNNVIGRPGKDSFQLSNVIDWEMSGIGSPYEDFALVEMSMEQRSPETAQYFWQGYGMQPDRDLQRHFSVARTLQWMAHEEPGNDFNSDFYRRKLDMIRQSI